MEWNYLSIPKLQRCNRWSLEMDKWFQTTLHYGRNYLSMLGLKLNHVSKRGRRLSSYCWSTVFSSSSILWGHVFLRGHLIYIVVCFIVVDLVVIIYKLSWEKWFCIQKWSPDIVLDHRILKYNGTENKSQIGYLCYICDDATYCHLIIILGYASI